MYHHAAMLRYTEAVEEAYHARVHDFADRIRATLPGVVEYDYCLNVVDLPGAYTHAIIGVFESVDSYAAYCQAPLHRELKDFMMQRAADVRIATLSPMAD